MAEAVAELVDSLRLPDVEMPGGVVRSTGTSGGTFSEGSIGEAVEAWTPKASSKGIVTFASQPAGAVVLVDGELVCQSTPCSKALPAGRHTVSMQAMNYVKREETATLGKGTSLNWELTPDIGWVTVDSVPTGLEVKVDDKVVGKTPLKQHVVAPGGHEVLVTSPCHYDAGERVSVKRGTERMVAVKLTPRQGAIDVTARDEKGNAVAADVLVDGAQVGEAPGVFVVSICAREVEVRGKGGGTWKKALSVKEKATLPLAAVLERGGKAGIDWVYSKPAGIYFARTEATLAQYRQCVDAGACGSKHHEDKSDNKYCNWGYINRNSHPMNCVDWYGAKQFCEWAGGRLPSEGEWEAEASNGGKREYPWGDEKPTCDRCVMDDGKTRASAGKETDGCGEDRTWPVCSKSLGHSVSGLCDMAGNVFEWTSSGDDSEKEYRVVRGGAWSSVNIGFFRGTLRFRFAPDVGTYGIGFRCVRSSQ